MPEFNEEKCFNFFSNKAKAKTSSKSFEFPPWLDTLERPSAEFNVEAPTYQEVVKVINYMRSSASPCPNDQISVIILKKCPIVQTMLWKIISHCWTSNCFPNVWKSGMTVLAYKKGQADNPENFRPITLQPVMSKVFTSVIKNRIYTYLCANNYIDQEVQKGFWSNISGTIEHTEMLTYVINHARNKQRSLVVSLIDLRNAFGEVNHDFLKQVLRYHHLPENIINIIQALYNGYKISVATKDFVTNPITIERGVLQGDSLSPLLFNMCFNTLMVTIRKEQIKCLGYVLTQIKSSKHWFQFADDTAITTSLTNDNQMLLNLFTKWSSWADLIIRVDKCKTFGIKKMVTSCEQFQPYLIISHQKVPAVPDGESFKYLGKLFNFGMDNSSVKKELIEKIENYLSAIQMLPVKNIDKIKIVNTYVYSKIRWWMSLYNLGITWTKQACDGLISRQVRLWLNMHPGANFTHLKLPLKQLGLNFQLPSDVFTNCQTTIRRILASSKDPDVRKIYHDTKAKYISNDEVIQAAIKSTKKDKKSECKRLLKNNLNESSWKSLMALKKESIIIKFLNANTPSQRISSWQKLFTRLPDSIFNFCRKYIILALPTKCNLKIWNQCADNLCRLCNEKSETLHHIVSNCATAAKENRYTWRHNSVIYTIMAHLSALTSNGYSLYADIEGYSNPASLFNAIRPDIVLIKDDVYHVIELTVCFETNLLSSHEYKCNKYKDITNHVIKNNVTAKLYAIEFSCLGFTSEKLTSFTKLLRQNNIDVNTLISKCSEVCCRASFYIFNRRDKPWLVKDLLKFV